MKFAGYLIEAEITKEKIIKTLDRDCAKFLKEMKGEYDLLFRGSYAPVKYIKKFRHNKDRSPKDTPQELHDHLNKIFKKKFGWPVRNGIFSVPSRSIASSYGDVYNFFPIGDYKYVYSTEIEDLYQWFEDEDVTTFFSDDNEYSDKYISDQYVDEMSDKIVNHIEVSDGKGMKFKTDDGRSIINIGKYMDHLEDQDMELEIIPEYSDDWSFVVYDKAHNDKIQTIYLVDWDKLISLEEYRNKNFGAPGSKEEKKINSVIETAVKTYKDTGLYKQASSLAQARHEITFWCDYYYLVNDWLFGHDDDDDLD